MTVRIVWLAVLSFVGVTMLASAVVLPSPSEPELTVKFGETIASFPRLNLPAGTRSERVWYAEHEAWFERAVVKPFAERAQGQPWEKGATDFLRQTVHAWRPENFTDPHPELAASGQAVLAQAGQEPLLRFFAAYWSYRNAEQSRQFLTGLDPMCGYNAKDGEREIDAMEHAVDALEKAGAPRGLLRLMAREIARAWTLYYYGQKAPGWLHKVGDWTAAALSDGSYLPAEAGVFVGHTIRWRLVDRERLPQMSQAVSEASLPPWARDTMMGFLASEAAWRDRGGGYADSVTSNGARGFTKNLQEADGLFRKAVAAEPHRPEAAAERLVGLLTGEVSSEDEGLSALQQAVTAEADYHAAYDKWIFYHRPRWGGSVADMLVLGRACLETRRYETDLPEIFVKSVFDAASEAENWRMVARLPWVSEGLVAVARAELADPARAGEREKLQSLLVTRAWMAGRMDVAKEALKAVPGGRLHVAALNEINRLLTYPDIMAEELAVAGTPAAEEYAAGEAVTLLYSQRDPAAALAHFQAALKLAPSGSEAERWLKRSVATAEWDSRYDKGEWAPVPLKVDAWRVRAGQFTNDAEGALVMQTRKDGRGFAWFPGLVGQQYEVRGHFAAAAGQTAPPLFGLAFRAHRTVSGEFLHFSCYPGKGADATFETSLRDHFSDFSENGRTPPKGHAPIRADNEFLLHVTPKAFSLQVNGEEVIPEFASTRYVRRPFDNRLGLTASSGRPDAATRITSLEVRKLPGGE